MSVFSFVMSAADTAQGYCYRAYTHTHTHTNRKHGGTPGMEHIVLLRPIKGNREFSLLKKKHYLYLSVPFYSEGAD